MNNFILEKQNSIQNISASKQVFALVDCNNFYVSCERAFNPKLQDIPVVVLSNNNGCVVARSSEVKELNVKMGMPWFKLKGFAKQHNIIALSSNYALYSDMSNRVVQILRKYSPEIEVYSIDESFLKLNGLEGSWENNTALGEHICNRVLMYTGLPVCVGIGSSKTLAKLANYIAKKRPEYGGVCDLNTIPEPQLNALFSSIDVKELWGVGSGLSPRLATMGIKTIQSLKEAPSRWLRLYFGVVMERINHELNGISCLDLEEIYPPKKQIISSRSFAQIALSIEELNTAAALYTSRAAEKLRQQNSACSAIHVAIRTSPFQPHEKLYSNSITIPLVGPTSDTRVLTKAALAGLAQIYRPGYGYKKVLIMLLDFSSASQIQENLFEADGIMKSTNLMNTLDSLNKKMGSQTIAVAATGIKRPSVIQSERVLRKYTTDWADVPIAMAK